MSESSAARSANALVFGAAVGLAIGMLVAPKSGRENRDRLKSEYAKTKDQLHKSSHEIADKVKSTARRSKDDAESAMSDSGQDFPNGPI